MCPGLVSGQSVVTTGSIFPSQAVSPVWNVDDWLYIGSGSSSGTLTISDGGKVFGVNNTGSIIGYFGTGTVTVKGPGSTWTNKESLRIGHNAKGTLIITDGGNVSNSTTYISSGTDDRSNGTVTVKGSGSTWTISRNLFVGGVSPGTLTILDGGKVSNVHGYLVKHSTVRVEGSGSTWTNSDDLSIDNTSTLTISDGGKVSSGYGAVGYYETGTVTVDGPGSTWTNSRNLDVGRDGTGSLVISSGAKVSNTVGTIGLNSGSKGTVKVTGADSIWTNSNDLHVGFSGIGTLAVEESGTVEAGGKIRINGASSLSLQSGGTLRALSNQADWITGSGSFTIGAGGARIDTQGYEIGIAKNFSGVGSLTKLGRGTLTLTGANTYSGSTIVNAGALAVSGSGASISHSSSQLIVGHSSGDDGALRISNGGKVINTDGIIGDSSGSSGTVTVEGLNSIWSNKGGLHVGNFGTGKLTVKDHGIVEVGTVLDINAGSSFNLGSGGTLRALSDQADWITGSGSLVLGSGDGRIDTQSHEVTIAKAFSGAGSLIKLGTGMLTLTGTNAYSGGTTIKAGQLNFTTNANLGDSASTLTIDGGILHNAADLIMDRKIVIGDAHATLDVENGYLTLRAPISGVGGLTKTGGNFLTLSGANTYTGPTVISGGNFKVEEGTLASGSVTLAAGTTFYMHDMPSYAGVISGQGRIVKSGAGTTALTGANTYRGTTEVNAGTLRLEKNNASSHYMIASGAVLELAPATEGYSASTRFSGSGILRKTGAVGARWAEAAATFALDAGSLIDVQQGTFVGGSHGNEVWTDNQSGLHVAAGALFNGVEANVRVDALTGSGTIRSGYTQPGYRNFTFGVANGSGVFHGTLTNNDHFAGHFVKVGTGTQTLTGRNTYTGTTTVKAGTLAVSGSGASITHTSADFIVGDTSGDDGTLTISGGGTVSNNQGRIGNQSGSAGTVTVTGAGSTWSNSNHLYVGNGGIGALTISDGGKVTVGETLFLRNNSTVTLNGGALHTRHLNLANGDFHFLGGTLIVNGVIGGDFEVSKAGVLGGNATIAGDLLMSGTLSPGNSTGVITVEGNLTLDDDAWTTLELASATDYDRIVVNGGLTYGGTLMLDFLDGFTPEDGAQFTLFPDNYLWSAGTFANIVFSDPDYEGLFDSDTGSLVVTVIPEPSAYGLMIATSAGLMLWHRRCCRQARGS